MSLRRGSRLDWRVVAAGAIATAGLEAAGAITLGATSLPLWRVDPLGLGPEHRAIALALALGTPLAAGVALGSLDHWLRLWWPAWRSWHRSLLLALLLVVALGAAATSTSTTITSVSLLALLVLTTAEATTFVLTQRPTAGVGAGLALAALTLANPLASLGVIALGVAVLVGLGVRNEEEAGWAFLAVLAYPSAAVVVGVPFVDWRLAGSLAATRAYLGALRPEHPLAALTLVGTAVLLAALASPRTLGLGLLASTLALGLAMGLASAALIATAALSLAVLAPALPRRFAGRGTAVRAPGRTEGTQGIV